MSRGEEDWCSHSGAQCQEKGQNNKEFQVDMTKKIKNKKVCRIL